MIGRYCIAINLATMEPTNIIQTPVRHVILYLHIQKRRQNVRWRHRACTLAISYRFCLFLFAWHCWWHSLPRPFGLGHINSILICACLFYMTIYIYASGYSGLCFLLWESCVEGFTSCRRVYPSLELTFVMKWLLRCTFCCYFCSFFYLLFLCYGFHQSVQWRQVCEVV